MIRTRCTVWLAAAGTGLLLASCLGGDGHLWSQGSELRAIEGCPDLEASIRRAAIRQMEDQLKKNMESVLNGQGSNSCWGEEDGSYTGSPGNKGGASAQEYSTTNVQEQGVDEADFVKNDGRYIYLVGQGAFTILQAWPPAETHPIASFALEGDLRLLYVDSDRAVIYANVAQASSESANCYDPYAGCTYGPASDLKITVLDIADRTAPRLVREILLGGSYVDSRRVGDAVHTVIEFPGVHFDGLSYWPDGINPCGGSYDPFEMGVAFESLRQSNVALINATTLADFLPTIADKVYLASGEVREDTNLMQDCRNFYEGSATTGEGFLGLLSLDEKHETPLHMTSIVGEPGTVYASSDALYVASGSNPGWGYYGSSQAEITQIHKFSLHEHPASSCYQGSGAVGGRILNQFSLGEHDGYLRVATTTGYLPDPNAFNSITVLKTVGDRLEITGQLTGIAPGEDIRSARFMGDRGYVVTFKKTDPLFVIDLANPWNPRIAGELKIPGFSTYMHPLDRNHLLTIGFDASDQGDFAWFTGIQLQIFDITEPNNPRLDHKELIGTRGSNSDATSNHLAFNYFAPKDLLAIPMVICEGGDGSGNYGDVMTFNGLMVYDVTAAAGFSLKGKVPHVDVSGNTSYCGTWWQNPNSGVKRSIIMDDFVYSISSTLLKVNALDDLGVDLVTQTIPLIPQEQNYYY